MKRRKLLLETFEDRILCSVTAPAPAHAPHREMAPVVQLAATPHATIAAAAPPGLRTAPADAPAVSSSASTLTDSQRQAIAEVVRDSTAQIWFEKNVGQFAAGVRYGFHTAFGSMMVYDDHLQILVNQTDPVTGAVGVHAVNVSFTGGNAAWQIVPGGSSGVAGSYQNADGTVSTPDIFKELTIRNVYDGVDLRLYSAAQGTLEFDWLVARAQDYQKIRMAFAGQDGISYGADGSLTLKLRFNDLTLKLPESYQVIGGLKQNVTARMVAGATPGEVRYAIDGNLVADQPLVIDPNVAWATFFDLNDSAGPFDSYLFAVAANSNGVYAFGWVKETITDGSFGNYLEVPAGFAQGTAVNQAYLYRFNNSGTNITAWTSTGVANDNSSVSNQALNGSGFDTPADLELFPDGRVLAAFNSGLLQIYSADLGTRSYSAEPVTMDSLNAVAIVDDNNFYVSGRVAAAIPAGQIAAANIGPDTTFAGGLEGVIVRYSNASAAPQANWATYVGGNKREFFTAIALTPDKTKLVFATTTESDNSFPALVNAVDSTINGTELLVGVLPEQATQPAAFSVFSYLGGTGNEGTIATNTTAAVITATNNYFYVAGNTVATDLPGVTAARGGVTNGAQTANGGGNFDTFVSRIALNGSAGIGFQSTYLGGNAEDNVGGIAYDTLADRLLVFGTTGGGTFPVKNTTPASNYFDGTFGGGTWDIFVATLTGNLATEDFSTYIGGSSNDYLGQTGDLIGQGHVIYSPATGLTYLATTVHSADIPASVIGNPPGKDTSKSNGTNDTHVVFAFNINIFDYGDAPLTYDVSTANAAREGTSTTLRLGALVDAEAGPASGAAATGDDLFNSGTGDDEDALASLPVLNVGDTSYSLSVATFNNTGAAQTLNGWIDFNRNGTFEVGEYATVAVPSGAAPQNVTLTWASVPALTSGQSYVRLRLTDTPLTDNAGTAALDERSVGTGGFGEVEDHALTIAPQPALAVSNVTATEGTDNYAVFTVGLSNVSSGAVTFNLALANATATGGGADYGTAGAGNLQVSTNGGTTWVDATSATIAAGTLSVLVRTPIVNDPLDENSETFTLTATRTAGNTANASTAGTGTIVDNDPAPGLTINDLTVNEAAGTATFTVTLSAASGLPVSVNYATSNGTATAGADYTSASGTLNFAAGVISQTITVPILNDALFEGSETFNVNLSGAVNASITDNLGVGTIKDDGTGTGGTDNDTPTISVSNPAVTEGTDAYAIFTVSLSNASTAAVTASFALANGTATGGGVDFGAGLEVSTNGGTTWTTASSATIAAGSTSVLVRTPLNNDTLDEAVENFTLTATRTAGTTTNLSAVGTATIADNDPPPALTINDVTVNEAAGTATFTVTLNTASGQALSVNYATSDGTATAGADYTVASGTLNFAAGVTTQTITVPILNDTTFEGSEAFNVNLSGAVNASITDNLGVGTIKDDGTGAGGVDNDTPTLSVSSPTVTEGTNPYAIFAVTLSNPSTTSITGNLTLTAQTATGGGVDFGPAMEVSIDGGITWGSGTAGTLPPGITSVLVRTPIINDTLNEPAETFTLTATRTAGTTTNASASGTATINDDDALPALTINDLTVNEAAGTATFTVTLNTTSGQAVSVNYATSNGTASAGADFTNASGTLNFAAGVTTQTITVPILNDTTFEGSETFNVNLSSAVNATIADNLGVGTIKDDGTGAGGVDNDTPTLSVSSPGVTEGTNPFAVFTVSLSNLSTTAVSVSLALANGTALGGGTDFGTGGAGNLQVSTDGGTTWADAATATIAAGSTSVLVRTPIVNDALDEANETFTLTATRTVGTTTNASALGTATITDDDATPLLIVNDVTVNEAAGTATFTVTLNTASAQAVSVNYATSNGTATAGADFASASGTLNFAAGVTTQTITVPILDDAVFENSETFNVNLSSAVNATIADNLGVGTIKDDGTGTGGVNNDTPTLSVSSPAVTEGTNPFAVFTVSLSNLSTTAVSVSLALANGTALGGGPDFGTGGAGNLQVSTDGGTTWADASNATIAAGSTSVLVRTPIVNDALDEANETFTLTATRTAGTTTNGSALGTATITDDDPTPALTINDVSVNEAAGTATFTVTLDAASGRSVSVNYATSNGTATAGADFTAASGTLTFAPGVTSQTVTVTIANDTTFEGSENFNVNLSGAANATIADNLGVGTILDDGTGPGGTDNDTPTLAVSSPTVTEGTNPFAVFTVSLSNASATPVNVSLALASATATGGGTDFGTGGAGNLQVSTDGGATWADSGSATIAAGSTSVLVRTPIVNDALDEANETFTLTATRTAGTTTNGSALGTATIIDDDPTPALTINDLTVNEAAGTATFTVTLDAASGRSVSVNYATSNGTATAGADYSAAAGSLTFAPGVTTQTITVPIFNDALFENSETFNVTLSSALNASIADNLGLGTIKDDGTGTGGADNDTPTLTVSNVSVTEGTDPHAIFSVALSNPSTTAVVVNLALANGTATGGGVDFGAVLEVSTDGGATWTAAGSATIAAGSTSVLVRTPIVNDALNEAAETFTLTATRTGGTTTNPSALGTATIVDDDTRPAFSINDVTVNEAAGTATFTVTLNAVSGQAVSVGYATSNGTATAGADYTAASGTLNFAAGVTSQTITVPILNDTTFEGSESFNVNLSGAVNATISDNLGLGTILDDGTGAGGADNDTPSLSVSNVTVTEGTDPRAVFAVSLSNLSTTPVSVNLALAAGTATGGGVDFGAALEVSTDGGATWNAAASATIAAGSTSVLVRTTITDDALDEAAETFTLTATRTAGTTTNASATGTATINDNDPTPSLTINDVTVNEGAGTATFTVTLNAVSGQPVSVNYTTSNGTAAAGADYTAQTGSLNFAAGVTSQTITVPILNDTTYEGSETFNVLLSGAVNATIADATGVGTILDDGTGAGGTDNDKPVLAVSSPTVTEGTDAFAVFTLSLSNASTAATTVSLALANGTALGGGADYGTGGVGNLQVSLDGGTTWSDAASATFAAGSTSVLVRTPITNDAIAEPLETFSLTATTTAGSTRNASATGTATIADDDGSPSITINDVTVNEAAGTATFTVRLTAVSALAISVDYTTSNGTAAAGADFTAVSGTLNFAPGVTAQTITVPILNDAIFENSEAFNVLLSNEVNAFIADGTGVGTIRDDGTGAGGTDNDTPTLAVSSPSVTEGTDPRAIFTVNLSNASTAPVSVNLALANGTATGGGVDFGAALEVSTDGGATWSAAASATIAPGSTSVLVRTPIANDALDEPAENFTLTATRTAGTTTNASALGTATIIDDDPTPTLSIDDIVVNEGVGTATFTVTLSAASGQVVSFNFATVSGTATAGADFTSRSSTLNFAAGTTTRQVTVPILNDSIYEGSESFTVLLSAAVNATIADNTGVGTILDDGTGTGGTDNDTPTLAVSGVSVVEGTDNFAVFTVSLTNPAAVATSVNLALTDGTATGGGVDFGAGGAANLQVSTDGGTTWTNATAATIAAGATSVLVRTPIVDDALNEAAENFTLTATRTAGTTTNAAATGTGTIADDDGQPTLSINDVTVNEAAGTATFTVTLNTASGLPITVNYATSNGTATAGADYTAKSGVVVFAAGETTKTVTVSILNDAVFEGSENFNVTLSTPLNAILADAAGVGTILDDGTGAGGTDNDTPTLSVSNATVTEGTDAYAICTVSLSNASTTPVTADVVFLGNTATGLGVDFGGFGTRQVSTDGGVTWTPAASVTFAPGTTSLLMRTPIIDDLLDENTEDLTLTATVTSGTTRNASATGTVLILDNDPTPTLAINDVTVNEAAGTATFTVTLSAASGLAVSVNYATSNGTATAGADYTGASGTLNFAPGVTSRTITVAIANDAIFEQSESYNLNLSGGVNATIADNLGLGTIKDDGTGAGGTDNDTPTFSVSNVSVTEGTDLHAVFAVNLSNVSTTPVSVSLALANGSATGGGVDYGAGLEISTDGGATWTAGSTATIAAGSTSVLVRTPINDDALNEFSEDFTLTATRTAGTTANASASGRATIADNDPTPTLTINDVTVNEAAGTATFTVTLSAASGLAVSANYATSNGTATAGADFTGTSGTLNFAPGVTSQTITVSIANDPIFEQSEAFNVLLSGEANATLADGTGLGTILDDGTGAGGTDNDTPTLSVSNVTATEGTNSHAVFAVSLSNLSTTPVSLNLALANGTATGGGVDFGTGLEVSTDGGATWNAAATATIAAGSSSVLVRTPIIDDALNEAAETFTLTATRSAGVTTNAAATGIATIVDNDALPTLSINDVTVNEGAGTATFTVTLNAASGQAVSVGYATSNGTATAADYTGATGTLNFAAGVTSQTITIAITNDTIFEQSESFNVTLSGAVNASIADGTGLGAILDDGTGAGGTDDDTPTISVSNVTVTEGTDAHAVFAVNLSNLSTTPVSVGLALANGSAMGGGVDFGAGLEVSTDGGATWNAAASATIAAGSAGVLVRTPITDDALNEAAETFTLTATRTAGVTTNTSATGIATIVDNDALPALAINDVTVNEAAGTATFTVTLNAVSGQAVLVSYAAGSGTALVGVDFSASNGALNFAPGVTSQTVTVPITNDAIFEGSENFTVTLAGAVNATIADATGLGTILDDGTGPGGTDNDTPSLSVSSVAVTEGTDAFAVFTVNLSNPSTTPVTVALALANGTATGGGVDFGAGLEVSTDGGATWTTTASATIAAGSTSVLVRTPIIDDALNESAENFTLNATVTAGTTTNAAAAGTGSIADDDGPPAFSIDDVTVNEAAGTATFTVSLSAASGQTVKVNYATSNGTALAGADYTARAGTLTFAAGVTSQTVTVPILNDPIFENSESFFVLLSNGVNAGLLDDTGVGTIRDDGTGPGGTDNDTPTLSVSNVTVTEGADPHAIFTVSLSNLSTTPVDVNLALANGTATGGGVDFGAGLEVSTDGGATWAAASNTTIAAGSASVLVRTPITDDALDEANENFSLTATVTGGTTTNLSASGTGTIVDDDATPTLAINDVTVNEGAGTATFTVTLSAASGLAVSVGYTTSNGTATAGADYTATLGTLNFAPGVTSQTITIAIANDAIFEKSENFDVLLNAPVNATLADGLGLGTIRDDGTGSGGTDDDTPTLSVANVSVTEGTDTHAIFAVTLSNASTTPVDLNLALSSGTATGGGTDFGPALEVSTDGGATWTPASNATFAPGSTSLLVRTPITDDALDENAENFTLTATVASGTTTNASATGTATIADDDATPTLAINDVTVNEAAGTATFTVTLSAASGLPVSVGYATSNGTATAGADFTGTSGTLNFAAGVTSQTITISIANDPIFEQSENFNVLLSGATNATIADGTGVGTILDDGTGPGGTDNDTPTLSVANVSVTEGTDPFAVFAVSLSNASATPVSVSLALANGSATGGGVDFGAGLEVSTDGGATWTAAASATFAPGSTSVLVRTPITDDALNELAENFTLTATVTAGITTNAAATGAATIADNDPTPTLSIGDVTVNEGAGTATFTVTLSAASGLAVNVGYATSNGTATAGADFTGAAGTLNFAPGVTTQTVTVAITNDALFEGSENFSVLLNAAVNATIADGTGLGTILDDGTGGGGSDNDTPTLSVSNVSVTEGTDAHAIFAVSLSNPSTTAVNVSLGLTAGTATGGGTDFGPALEVSTDGGTTWTAAASAIFTPGRTSLLARTPITDDASFEVTENFTLTATVTAGITANAAVTGTATVFDNDIAPTLSIDDLTINETAGTATFTVTLNTASGIPISVNYATSNGAATAGADYAAAGGTLTFAPGVTSQTVTVSILDDARPENTEAFSVVLSGAVNATIADGTGVGTILDNDVRQANLTLIGTSDAGSSGSNVVVGEVVTYELKFELTEGVNPGVVLHDLLPTGLQFLPNAPVQVAYLNVASSISGLAAGTYTNSSADAMISASLTANDDTYGDGTDVFFKLGTLTDNDGADADREYVTIRFNAVVTNTALNQSGVLQDNTFAALLDTDGNSLSGYVSVDRNGDNAATGTEIATDPLNDGTGTPGIANTVTTQVAEPILALDKQITSAPAAIKAGDTITYTVTISHAAGSGGTAWEATLADAVPAGLQLAQIDSVTLAGGAQEQSAAAIGGGGTTLGGVWDIPVGGSVTVVYRATVTSGAVLGSTLNNLADLTWSSLDGTSADERGSGNGLFGAGGLNDYELQQSASATIDGGASDFSLTKQILGDNNAEIGERLTYQLTLKVADGIINGISLNDLIPAGFKLVSGSASLTPGAGVAVSGANFTYASNQLTLDIAQLQSAVDGLGNTITFTYAVDVLDTAANDAFGGPGTATKTNFAGASYDPGSGPITASDSVTLNVVEPTITASESVTSAPVKPNAGDTVTFQVVIGHGAASTGNAYNVVYTDTLPAKFGNVQLTGVSGTAATLPAVGDFTLFGNTILTVNPFDLALGENVVLTYTAVIQDTVTPGEVLTNNALVTAQSTDASPSGNTRTSASATNSSNYQETAGATLTADATFDLAKIANVTAARIGDRVHYTITVKVIEGTTPGMTLTDALPSGPAIDPSSIQITYGAPGMNSSNAAPASVAGNTLTLDFATLTNPGDNNAANDTVTIEYDEVVSNNASDNNGNVKTNLVAGTYTGLGAPVSASANVTLTEPVLGIVKTVNDATPHLGQTITYTLVITHNAASTASAFDLALNDALPAGVSLNAASIQLASAPAGTSIASNSSVDGGAFQLVLNQLALGQSATITFTATVSTDPAIIGGTFGGGDDTLSSTVALSYDSQPGAVPEQRAGNASAANTLTVVGADLAVTKSDGQATATAGSQLTYTITVTNNGTDAATNVIVTDTLPASGVTFHNAGSTAGATVAGGKVVYQVPSLAAGATAIFTVVVDVANPTAAGVESIANLVDVTHDDIEPTAADNTVTDTDTLVSVPDYTITVTDNRTSAKPGEVVNYVITVKNVGNQNGTGVVVSDAFTTGLFSSVVADRGGVVDLVNGAVVWNLGALAAGDSITLTLHGTLNATFTTIPVPVGTLPGAVPDNDAIAHTLNVADDGAGGADPTLANNTATDRDDLQPVPELKITQTDTVTLAKPGQLLTYRIVATNAGAQDSNGMIVTDVLPKGVKLVRVASSDPALTGPPTVAGGTITWHFTGTVPAGEAITFTVVVRVEAGVKPGSQVVNRVKISDDGFYGPDAVTLSDNTATDTDAVPQAEPAPKPDPAPAPRPAPFVFAFDTFHNFALEGRSPSGGLGHLSPIDLSPDAILPLVPIYSGEADPGATLVISLYNARGERIGSQTVVADAGGNWLATFPSTTTRDIPNSVEITSLAAPYSFGDSTGHNLRTYYSPALNPGNFVLQALGGGSFGDESAPLLGGLGLENPLQLGSVKYGGELLGTQATAGGY